MATKRRKMIPLSESRRAEENTRHDRGDTMDHTGGHRRGLSTVGMHVQNGALWWEKSIVPSETTRAQQTRQSPMALQVFVERCPASCQCRNTGRSGGKHAEDNQCDRRTQPKDHSVPDTVTVDSEAQRGARRQHRGEILSASRLRSAMQGITTAEPADRQS